MKLRTRSLNGSIGVTLAACLLVALLLRIWGMRFGLPQLYYWDEPTVVNRAMRFGTGDFNPHYFYYPALYKYVLFVSAGVYYVLGKLTGSIAGAQEFARTYFVDPTGVYLSARATTAVVGVLGVAATFALGKRYFDARVGLVAAAVLAVSPLHVTHSHIAITDVPHALLICLATLAALRVLERGLRRDYVICGLLIGLGTATKYLAVLNCVTLAVAHILRDDAWLRPRVDVGKLLRHALFTPGPWLGLACTVLGFFVGSPYNILAFSEFVTDFRSQMTLSSGGAGQGALLLRTAVNELGWPACVLGAFGLLVMLRERRRSTWVLLTFPAVYGLLMLDISKSFARYSLPQSAFVAVAVGVGFCAAVTAVSRQLSRVPVERFVAGGLLALVLAWPLALSVSWSYMQSSIVDTRTHALVWAERELPRGAKVAIQALYDRTFDNVPVVTDKTLSRLERVLPTGGSFGAVRQQVLDAWSARPVFTDVGWSDEGADLEKSAPRYVLITEAYGRPAPSIEAFLERNTREIKRFHPDVPWPLRWLKDNGSETLPVIPPRLIIYESQAR